MVSPVDGQIVGAGTIVGRGSLKVKGETLSFERLVGASEEAARGFTGGTFVVLFLSPHGYHRVHMPRDGTITGHQWIDGELLPQNLFALEHIPRVHERNARVVLHCSSDEGEKFILIMVGAGVVSGIHIIGLTRPVEPQTSVVPCAVRRRKGDEIGYFSLGSTVVLLTQTPCDPSARYLHARMRMGEPLFKQAGLERAHACGQTAGQEEL
jgi:phosphatidylserine decarboxylase